jgi:hypothetical protein
MQSEWLVDLAGAVSVLFGVVPLQILRMLAV